MQRKETEVPREQAPNKNKTAIIIIAAALGAILLLGVILGVVLVVREAGAVVSYGGVTITEGVASYIASTTKATYIGSLRDKGIEAYDDAQFWQSEYKDGMTYKDDFARQLEGYIRRVAVSAYLFDRHTALDSAARAWINEKTTEVLDHTAGGSISAFNKEAEPMGFTYSDFCLATELLYKAERAVNAVYGEGGVGLATDANLYICEEYLKEYAHVKLLYIRTSDKFLTDDNGNRVVENGKDVLTPLSNDEKAARLKHIAEISAAIDALKTGGNGRITEQYFNSFYEYYNDEPEYSKSGYYFKSGAAYTEWYRENVYSDVVDMALSMNVGEFEIVKRDEAVIVIYRTECPTGAYMAYGLEDFFVDFYERCATEHLYDMVTELLPEVVVKDAYHNINLVKIYQNTKFKIK